MISAKQIRQVVCYSDTSILFHVKLVAIQFQLRGTDHSTTHTDGFLESLRFVRKSHEH